MKLTVPKRGLVLLGVCTGVALSALDSSIVGTAMPTVIASLGGIDLYTWVFAAYMLASTTAAPTFGKLSDLFGQKWLYTTAIVVFLIGSALCGQAQTMPELIIFRGLQGIGGGALLALGFTVVGHVFSPTERPKAQGTLAATWAIGSVMGPATGGFIIDQLSWRWTFYVNVPIGIIAALLILANLEDTRLSGRKPIVDFAGAALLTGSIVSLLFALRQSEDGGWTSPSTLGLFALTAILLLVFVWNEHRSPEPIVPLPLFRLRTFTVCNVESLITGAALFGATGFIPLFVQGVLKGSATSAGLALMPLTLGWTFGSITSGQLVNRLGYRNMCVFGTGSMVVGFYLLVGMGIDSTIAEVGRNVFVAGIGIGSLTPVITSALQNAVPRTHMGVASSSMHFYRGVGGAVGVSAMGAILNSQMDFWTSRLADSGLVHTLPAALSAELGDPQLLLDPELNRQLPPALASALELSLSNSLHTVFWVSLVILVIAVAFAILLPNITPAKEMQRARQEQA